MTPEQQRIAIAEACGWKKIGPKGFGSTMIVGASPNDPAWPFTDIPDYLHDLNAMHEAESVIHRVMRAQYIEYIAQQTGGDYFSVAHATAAQRAEAFLRAKDVW